MGLVIYERPLEAQLSSDRLKVIFLGKIDKFFPEEGEGGREVESKEPAKQAKTNESKRNHPSAKKITQILQIERPQQAKEITRKRPKMENFLIKPTLIC